MHLSWKSTRKIVLQKTVTLSDAMFIWLKTYKKPKLKKTSYDTLELSVRGLGRYDLTLKTQRIRKGRAIILEFKVAENINGHVQNKNPLE